MEFFDSAALSLAKEDIDELFKDCHSLLAFG